MYTERMLARRSFLITISALCSYTAVCAAFAPLEACSQTLKDVLESDAMHTVQRQAQKPAPKQDERSAPRTHYDSLWTQAKPGPLLLQWIGAKIPGFKVGGVSSSNRDEYAFVHTILTDRARVAVQLIIQVPKPQYITMAEYRTLVSFNRFRPPLLDVIADQTLPFNDLQAQYYRARDGACSLLFEIEKHSIVNLRVEKCSDSPIMMEVAKALNFTRLNQKLAS
jgi:hypothetical protein